MDGGPFRVQRPVERRAAASRPEPVHRRSEEPQPVGEPLKPTYDTAAPHHIAKERKLSKRFLWPVIAIIVILGLVGGWFAWSNMQNTDTAINGSECQAIFFTNGQVYFGKLHSFNGGYMKLTDVYYLQSQQSSSGSSKDSSNPQATSTDQSNVQLIKLGGEIHGPEDQMIISKDQMLFYENLKPDGKVSQSISKFKVAK